SSGMYVRLGFAVAVEVDPDILLIDEVLGVGDISFQRKCIQRIKDFRTKGKTMLIVSHDLGTIQSMSDRILLLHEGTIMGIGEPDKIVSQYQAFSIRKDSSGLEREWGTGQAMITKVEFMDGTGNVTTNFIWGQPLKARIHYKTQARIDDPVFGFSIADSKGRRVYGNNTQIEKFRIPQIQGEGCITLGIDRLTMARGTYLFSFSIHSSDHKINYHRLDNYFPIAVECESNFEGSYMPCRWVME
ncbi:unnamed protein product, partial [marine sediment metagenome]